MTKFALFLLLPLLLGGVFAAEPLCRDVLPGEPWNYTPDIGDRAFWGRQAGTKIFGEIIKNADRALGREIAAPSEELYMEFSTNGNRTRYEKVLFDSMNDLRYLALAACASGDPKYIRKAEEIIRMHCGLKTWVLPAHDVKLKNYRGEVTEIDLVVTDHARTFAIIMRLLKPQLDEGLAKQLHGELMKRVVTPFEAMLAGKQSKHWLTAKSNWNSVCLSGVGGMLLAMELEPERRWRLLDQVVKYTGNFLRGFGEDGYCSEGVSYWNYGFTNYLRLSAALYLASDGKLNLMARPKAQLAAEYPAKIQISQTVFPTFSDCPVNAGIGMLPRGLIDFLLHNPSYYWRNILVRANAPLEDVLICMVLPRPEEEIDRVPSPAAYSAFPVSGVFVGRPGDSGSCRLSVAFKGGSNHEFHNHNDVGSYIVVMDGTVPAAVDPGGEVYTARTFSDRRYESNLLNSFGHSVPKINGQLQSHGADTGSVLLDSRSDGRDTMVRFNIRPAYREVKNIRKLERIFEYSREGEGRFAVIDEVEFGAAMAFENAIITFGEFRQTGKDALEITYKGKKLLVKIDTGGKKYTVNSTEIKENSRWKETPKRIAIALSEPAKTIRMKLIFTPLE